MRIFLKSYIDAIHPPESLYFRLPPAHQEQYNCLNNYLYVTYTFMQ